MSPAPALPAIGIDIGGVLVDRAFHDSDTSFFGSRPMETPAVLGCFDSLRSLCEMFNQRVHIVSKAGPRVASLSMSWLQHHGVFDYLDRDNVWFVDRRSEKAFYAEELGLTHFVDDRLDVLSAVNVRHRFWFVGRASGDVTCSCPQWAVRCDSWKIAMSHIRWTLQSAVEGG